MRGSVGVLTPADMGPAAACKRIAVMQPYFFPYAGYFRLFADVDEFILFDCVQFPRRGRVHRTELASTGDAPEWLTLPLAAQARDVPISGLAFTHDARAEFDRRLDRLGWLQAARGDGADRVREYLRSPLDGVVDFLETGLALVAGQLGFSTPVIRSSTLGIDPALRAQDRVLAIARQRGASHYLNSPGGRRLYDADAFAQQGVTLEFLPEYHGRYMHLLPALVAEPASSIREDVLAAMATPLDPSIR